MVRRRQLMAADRGDPGRPDEHPGPGRPLRRRDAETLVGELDDDGFCRLRDRAHPLVPVRVQDGVRRRRCTSSAPIAAFFGKYLGQAGLDPEQPPACSGTAHIPEYRRIRRIQIPAVDAGLLPDRLRGDHAAPDAGLGARPDQLQGMDPVRRALDRARLHDQRLPDLGRRLLRPARSGRLLRRLRHPPRRRRLRLRRGMR